LELPKEVNVDELLQKVKDYYSDEQVNDEDGVKIDFPDAWVHLRKSNTEPIVRVYSEAGSPEKAKELAQSMINVMRSFI
jgi:phosphomannomutase